MRTVNRRQFGARGTKDQFLGLCFAAYSIYSILGLVEKEGDILKKLENPENGKRRDSRRGFAPIPHSNSATAAISVGHHSRTTAAIAVGHHSRTTPGHSSQQPSGRPWRHLCRLHNATFRGHGRAQFFAIRLQLAPLCSTPLNLRLPMFLLMPAALVSHPVRLRIEQPHLIFPTASAPTSSSTRCTTTYVAQLHSHLTSRRHSLIIRNAFRSS